VHTFMKSNPLGGEVGGTTLVSIFTVEAGAVDPDPMAAGATIPDGTPPLKLLVLDVCRGIGG